MSAHAMNKVTNAAGNAQIVRGSAAERLLADEVFRREWAGLLLLCPWATAFQGARFVRTWYQIYHERYEPLLVLSRGADGRLMGLLTLAASTSGGAMVVAGSHHAEYHVWLCAPESAGAFPPAALAALRQLLPSSGLRFRYLPPGTPTEWIADAASKRFCLLKPVARPLLRFGDGVEINKSMNKSSNKSRLKRLKKLGPLEFIRVTDPEQFDRDFDAIIRCYDSRNLAVHETAPFRNDPLKKPFHQAMMRVPGLLHATVLKVGNEVVSAQLNLWRDREVHLGLIAHNPFLAKHSPGKQHIFFLAKMLMEQGFDQLDLTPGGDTYKERFANARDQASILTLFPTPYHQRMGTVFDMALGTIRRVLGKYDITPRQAAGFAGKIIRLRPPALLRQTCAWLGSRTEARIYRAGSMAVAPSPLVVRRDALDDLLAYQPVAAGLSSPEFASIALSRIEEGQHSYTFVHNGRLQHVGWLAVRPSPQSLSGALKGLELPPDSALILDIQSFDATLRGESVARSLPMMLRDASRELGINEVFVAVAADDRALRKTVERMGFSYDRSVYQQIRFGRDPRRPQSPPVVSIDIPRDEPDGVDKSAMVRAKTNPQPARQRAREVHIVQK